jgi:hypothetical protein
MNLSSISQSWKNFVGSLNAKGIPIPMVRYKGEGNPALTLVFVSAALVVGGIFHLKNIDMASAMSFFYASSTLFFGHSWVHKDALGGEDKVTENNQNQGPTS